MRKRNALSWPVRPQGYTQHTECKHNFVYNKTSQGTFTLLGFNSASDHLSTPMCVLEINTIASGIACVFPPPLSCGWFMVDGDEK